MDEELQFFFMLEAKLLVQFQVAKQLQLPAHAVYLTGYMLRLVQGEIDAIMNKGLNWGTNDDLPDDIWSPPWD